MSKPEKEIVTLEKKDLLEFIEKTDDLCRFFSMRVEGMVVDGDTVEEKTRSALFASTSLTLLRRVMMNPIFAHLIDSIPLTDERIDKLAKEMQDDFNEAIDTTL